MTGGALTTALTPDNITATVVKYLQAEDVDIASLKPDQIEGIVTKFAEAANCDRSELLTSFTAVVTEYQVAEGVKLPTIQAQVGLTGYDTISYRRFLAQNKVEVKGVVRLSEIYEKPSDVLFDEDVKFYDRKGMEIPVEAVPTEQLTADRVAVLGDDGTLHVLISPEVTGTQEAVEEMREAVDEVDQLGVTMAGRAIGLLPTTLMGYVDSALQRIETYRNPGFLDFAWLSDLIDASGRLHVLDTSMQLDFNAENIAELSTYVAEVVAAIQNGEEVNEADIQNLQDILTLISELDTLGIGGNVIQGIAQGMTEGGWDTDAETVVSNLEAALNQALDAHSPAQRMVPMGENIAAGIGQGAEEYVFSSAASAISDNVSRVIGSVLTASLFARYGTDSMSGIASAMTGYSFSSVGGSIGSDVRSAVNNNLNTGTLKSAGMNAMSGLMAGINAGRSGVIAAMRGAVRAAVNAAKSELKIASPSGVFRDEVGVMAMRGFGEGALKETKEQVKAMKNAARFLTDAAQEGVIGSPASNSRTYNQNSTVNLNVQSVNIRDEQDIRSLAIEIAALTKRQQRGKGLRMA